MKVSSIKIQQQKGILDKTQSNSIKSIHVCRWLPRKYYNSNKLICPLQERRIFFNKKKTLKL